MGTPWRIEAIYCRGQVGDALGHSKAACIATLIARYETNKRVT